MIVGHVVIIKFAQEFFKDEKIALEDSEKGPGQLSGQPQPLKNGRVSKVLFCEICQSDDLV